VSLLHRYIQLFAQRDNPVLPPTSHRVAWALANQYQNRELMRALVARLDAPSDLRAQYATLEDPQLRATFLARPDVTDAERGAGLAGERRADVLVKALKKTGWANPTVIQAAVAALAAKPTKGLAVEMTSVPTTHLTGEQAATVLRALAALTSLKRSDFKDAPLIRVIRRAGREAAVQTLPECRNSAIAAAILRFDLPGDLVRQSIERLGIEMFDTGDLNVIVFSRPDKDELARWVRQQLEEERRGRNLWGPSGKYWLQPWSEQPHTQPAAQQAGSQVRRVGTVDLPDLRDYALSPDPRVVAQVADRLLTFAPLVQYPNQAAYWNLAAQVLLQNPALGLTDRHRLMDSIRDVLAPANLGKFDALTWFAGDEKVRRTWCEVYPASVLRNYGWAPFAGIATPKELMRRWAADPDKYEHELRAGISAGLDPEVLLDLPLPAVRDALVSLGDVCSHGHVVETSLALERAIAARLGDNPVAWHLYDRLFDEFTGTLGELLDATAAATAA